MSKTIDELAPGALLMEPREVYDDALLGTTFDGRAIYDSDKVVELCAIHEEMSYEDAEEWHNFNTFDAYAGPKTPVYTRVLNDFSVDADEGGEE